MVFRVNIVADSRGIHLQQHLNSLNEWDAVQYTVTVLKGRKMQQLWSVAKNLLSNNKADKIYLFGGICNLTEPVYHGNIRYFWPSKGLNFLAADLVQIYISIYEDVRDNGWFGRAAIIPEFGADLLRYNQIREPTDWMCRFQEQLDYNLPLLHVTAKDVNKHLGVTTPWTLDVLYKSTRGGTRYPRYHLLYDGLHPTELTAKRIVVQILKDVDDLFMNTVNEWSFSFSFSFTHTYTYLLFVGIWLKLISRVDSSIPRLCTSIIPSIISSNILLSYISNFPTLVFNFLRRGCSSHPSFATNMHMHSLIYLLAILLIILPIDFTGDLNGNDPADFSPRLLSKSQSAAAVWWRIPEGSIRLNCCGVHFHRTDDLSLQCMRTNSAAFIIISLISIIIMFNCQRDFFSNYVYILCNDCCTTEQQRHIVITELPLICIVSVINLYSFFFMFLREQQCSSLQGLMTSLPHLTGIGEPFSVSCSCYTPVWEKSPF